MESLAASNKAPKVEINIEEWHSDLNFGSDGHGEACRNFVDFVDNEVQQEIGKIHNYGPVTALCLTVLAILGGAAGLIFRIFAIIDLASFNAVAAVGLVASFIWLMRRRRGFPDRREEIIKRGENRKTAGLAKIGHAADELREMHRLWTEEVQKKDSLIEFLNAEGNSMPVPPALTGQSTLTVAGEGPQAELPGGVAAGADNQSGDDQPFAFRLPHWDLQPPSSTDGALRG
jgi:hypothetical protein